MSPFTRNLALLGAGAFVAVFGLYGLLRWGLDLPTVGAIVLTTGIYAALCFLGRRLIPGADTD